jgi:ABC-type glycerol-3-phosphate transport system permease component
MPLHSVVGVEALQDRVGRQGYPVFCRDAHAGTLLPPKLPTVQRGLRAPPAIPDRNGWGPLFAMSILSLIPIFHFFVGAQKYLVRGIAMTGLK